MVISNDSCEFNGDFVEGGREKIFINGEVSINTGDLILPCFEIIGELSPWTEVTCLGGEWERGKGVSIGKLISERRVLIGRGGIGSEDKFDTIGKSVFVRIGVKASIFTGEAIGSLGPDGEWVGIADQDDSSAAEGVVDGISGGEVVDVGKGSGEGAIGSDGIDGFGQTTTEVGEGERCSSDVKGTGNIKAVIGGTVDFDKKGADFGIVCCGESSGGLTRRDCPAAHNFRVDASGAAKGSIGSNDDLGTCGELDLVPDGELTFGD